MESFGRRAVPRPQFLAARPAILRDRGVFQGESRGGRRRGRNLCAGAIRRGSIAPLGKPMDEDA